MLSAECVASVVVMLLCIQAAVAGEPEEINAEDEELRERLHAMRTA